MAPTARPTSGAPVDWAVAARVASRLVRPGPATDRAQVADLVADLHRAAATAADHVGEATGMRPADGDQRLSRVRVVDRRTWARANTEMVDALTGTVPLPAGERPPSAAGRLAGGVQAGAVLAVLASRVLGQFDPFSPRAPAEPGTTAAGSTDGGGPSRGRLLLVAPNVLTVERVMRVDPADFRLWVALHEQTHALQFATAPWLEGHLRARMGELLAGLADDDGPFGLAAARSALSRRGAGDDGGGLPALLPPATRRALDEVGAVMALLEGHADVTTDLVGRAVVPSVRQIRARFDRRRAGSHRLGSVLLRRALGLDLKLAQYRDGATFVRRVRRWAGPDGLNAVWADPDNLPTAQEIAHPRTWVRRVHG
ncbi:zinc-dependent metalloprotease [uncultured Cellulomonas sp.]|uniref:zinc-dependent metalloprotease n=1 Tax=uncultured Cellulomonas sp. TaxID=189682 RepID=UPI00260757D0|nr:zinc-dependent metalloprotease [uncultured Cellulomonas sp.]